MAISTWEPSELDRWKQRAEQAEARVEQLEREVNEEWVTRGMPSWRSRAKQAEAELEALKCCGNCRTWWELLSCDYHVGEVRCVGREGNEKCAYTPSRWTPREEASS
jgi:hypothetical protein